MSEELKSHLSDKGVLTLTMNRPDVHNAFDEHQILRLTKAIQKAESDSSVRIVVLAGEGRSFSAGGDINYMRQMGHNNYDENVEDASRLALLMKTLNFLPKPTIAKVQGAAMGGGVGLVSCCDFAIGSSRAKFALSEVKLGMIPATIGPYVVRTIGENNARRLFLSGQTIDAAHALNIGFLSELVNDDQLVDAVDTLCQQLLKNAPNSLALAKKLAIEVADTDITDEMIEKTVKTIADIRDSDEGREGLSAFLEKRPPTWTK